MMNEELGAEDCAELFHYYGDCFVVGYAARGDPGDRYAAGSYE
jgi:hypothetical protein